MLTTFSLVDYKDNINNPGIVYPLDRCDDDTPSLSSILCYQNGMLKIVRTESRLVHNNKEDVVYEEGKTLTVVRGYKEEPNLIESMFFDREEVDNYQVKNGISEIKSEEILDIIKSWLINDFEPDVSDVFKKNIEEEKFNYYGKGRKQQTWGYNYNKKKDFWWYKGIKYDEDEVEDMRDELEEYGADKHKVALMQPINVIKMYIDEGLDKYIGDRYAL